MRGDQIRFEDWRLLKSDYLVVGQLEPAASGHAVRFELYNVATGQRLLGEGAADDGKPVCERPRTGSADLHFRAA